MDNYLEVKRENFSKYFTIVTLLIGINLIMIYKAFKLMHYYKYYLKSNIHIHVTMYDVFGALVVHYPGRDARDFQKDYLYLHISVRRHSDRYHYHRTAWLILSFEYQLASG